MEVGDRFFPEFLQLIRDIHSRGMAYVDLEKPENILVGSDGRPYLIDFQIAFYVPPKLLGETTLMRFLRKLLQRADMYHVMKHYRRVRPDQLTAEQMAYGRRRPLPVRMGNVLIAPWKKIARKFGR
jgi:serine/threonine protein kinase